MSVLACGSGTADNGGAADEASVVPGSTCEATDDYGVVNLDITFPGSLNASQIIAITRWSNADVSCAPTAARWSTNVGNLTGTASWEGGAVYVRQSDEFFIDMGARIGVVMDCEEAKFLGAEVRLDMAHDGQGKVMAKCTRATL